MTIERFHTVPRMSKMVRHAGLLYLCGQTSVGSPALGIEAQANEMLDRVDALLVEAGSSRGRILAATIHLRDMSDFAAMNRIWEAWLPAGAAPARTTVEARLAAPELLVEVTIVAAS